MNTKQFFVDKKIFVKPKGDFYNYYINNNMITHPDYKTIYNYFLKKYHNINNWWWHDYPKDWEKYPDSFPIPIYWWLYPGFPYISDQSFFDQPELIPKTDYTEYIDYIDYIDNNNINNSNNHIEHFESSYFGDYFVYFLIILIVICSFFNFISTRMI